MDYAIISQPGVTRFVLSGQFTSADNMKFKRILDMLTEVTGTSVTLDFAGIDFIDSAGLGMLLLLRDLCQTRNLPLTITSARGQVQKIFLISRFDQLFTLSDPHA